jgi:collagenase-like PrtC family protease
VAVTPASDTHTSSEPDRRPELLAPAGDERALRAALAAGADAVYLGLERFSARAFAGNFAPAQLLEAIDRAHLWGAHVHLALNTQLKQGEVGPALQALEAPYAAGLDALIVADLGFAAQVRRSFPGLALHASTQLNTHSSAQLETLAGYGFRRAVLARELSLAEIAELEPHGIELEAFVHGALCYGYSGNCLFASMVGGRSGNRGRCTQACRMRYELRPARPSVSAQDTRPRTGEREIDARQRPGERETGAWHAGDRGGPRQRASDRAAARQHAGDRGAASQAAERVLSASDLAALEALPQLLAAGVSAFKIEGRMKDAGYVATATAVYREALQAAVADPDGFTVLPEWRRRLEQSFSRGFTTAHLQGRHAEVRSRDRGGHRGVQVGRVEQIDESLGRVVVRLSEPVAAGDVLTIFTPWGQSEAVRVPTEALAGVTGSGQAERLVLQVRERVALRDRVFRLSAAAADAFTEDAVAGRVVARPLPLEAELHAAAGEVPRLRVRSGALEIEVRGDEPLAVAERARLNPGRARDAVGALGGTPYRLAEFHASLEGDPFLPVGALKELRRRALAELDARRLAPLRRPIAQAAPAEGGATSQTPYRTPGDAPLPVVLRILPHEAPLAAPGVTAVALDIDTGDDPAAVGAALERAAAAGHAVRCRPPEVLFDADLGWWSAVAALPWAAVYVRHLVHLTGAPSAARILEYPLQGLNAETARLLCPWAVVAGPEASLEELADLAARLAAAEPAISVEALVFGRQQLLLTRDVLGRAEGLVAEGDRAALELVDTKDFVFPAEAAPEGTRIFNSRVTNLAAARMDLAAAGVSAAIVVQRDLSAEEREAMAAGGLAALAAFAGRERSTTGHLFRGVA